uniref:Uncharacterized protein n=1 Tax=Rhizophora mucronata TaxID=61149 RepID=A0A2P2PQK5_RHIMU
MRCINQNKIKSEESKNKF